MVNWTDIQAHWAEYRKKVQSNWNKLTLDQINKLDGKRDDLSRLIQSSYRCNQQEAESQIELWLSNLLGLSNPLENKHDAKLDDKLKENQDSAETIVERDEIVGSPYHKGY